MFEAHDLCFAWPGRAARVLDGVSITVAPAEIIGIRGPSGAGKTTLARVLAGYLRPACGTIHVDGGALPERGTSPVQLIFQHAETATNPRWTVGRILAEGWMPGAAVRRRFGIQDDWLGRYPHELSGGELQRVAIVRSLVPTLRVLIADELTAMLDAVSQVRIWRVLLDLSRERGFAIVAISHDEALLKALGARLLSLEGGRLNGYP
jgi:peptide/nickel transport system ATP-binding protein